MNITQIIEQYQRVLTEEVQDMAWKTETIKRRRKVDAATLVQTLIFGYWQEPDIRISGLTQVAARRDVTVTESAMSQRFTPECAELLKWTLGKLVELRLQGEKIEIKLLKQFSAVVVEDSSTVTLPDELAEIWEGCGGSQKASHAAVKLLVSWEILTGTLHDFRLEDGRTNDQKCRAKIDELPADSLYIADLGFYDLDLFREVIGKKKERKYIVTRLHPNTYVYTRSGHKIDLKGILPRQVGQVREMGVICGKKQQLVMRLIMVRVYEEVAQERQAKIQEAAQKHGRQPAQETLEMTHWTLILTNVPKKRANYREILVLLRLRWQIERLFRLWKEHGKIDEWRSKKPYRILCEFYAKLCAMVMQNTLIQEGCWDDAYRSYVKAAAAIRRECNRMMVAFYKENIEEEIHSILRPLGSGCQIDHRKAKPSTAQLLLEGLDWPLELLA
jgi:hypothetical protein